MTQQRQLPEGPWIITWDFHFHQLKMGHTVSGSTTVWPQIKHRNVFVTWLVYISHRLLLQQASSFYFKLSNDLVNILLAEPLFSIPIGYKTFTNDLVNILLRWLSHLCLTFQWQSLHFIFQMLRDCSQVPPIYELLKGTACSQKQRRRSYFAGKTCHGWISSTERPCYKCSPKISITNLYCSLCKWEEIHVNLLLVFNQHFSFWRSFCSYRSFGSWKASVVNRSFDSLQKLR